MVHMPSTRPVVLNDNLTVNCNGSLTLGGAISNGGNGPMGITLSAGLLVLAGGNTYTGNTTISGGTVTLAHRLAARQHCQHWRRRHFEFCRGYHQPEFGRPDSAGNIVLATAALEPVTLKWAATGRERPTTVS